MKKKLLTLVLTFALLLGIFPTTGIAAETNEFTPSVSEIAAITATLQYVEEDKNAFNLDEVDFSNLFIGNKIYAYEYTENILDELYYAFPIFYNGRIIALATKVSEDNFQIAVNLVSELNKIRSSNIALVYDSDAVYVFNGDSFSLLNTSPVTISYRQSFQNGYPDMSMENIKLCDLKTSVELNYAPSASPRAQTYFSCPVKYVPQGTGTEMCWAATIACIVNYVKSRSLTAKDVAVAEYGSVNYNQGMSTANCATVLQDTYNLNYTYINHAPSDLAILENIQTGYPLYGSFGNDHRSHAGTIFGINIVSGYITVMDPMMGSTTALSKNGEYTYFNTVIGENISLEKAICSVWD